tara:strand:+ start:18132 stop:18746 length:615 start_codon:yes stop_codon:yes gene_type:complete
MLLNEYKEIQYKKKGIYKERGSKFISYAFPVYSEQQIKKRLEEVRRKEYAARHHCYAYILHPDKSAQRTNDDGEPSSTAGKPILGQILSNDLTNILIVVSRYFGGTKLGIPGLINAYKSAASDAISRTKIITRTMKEYYEVNFIYNQMNDVMRIIKKYNLETISTNFEIECKLVFKVEKNKSDLILNAFKNIYNLKIIHLKTNK